MNVLRLFSPCCFGHAADPLLVLKKGIAYWECRRCHQELGSVLGVKPKKMKARKRKSADVLQLAKKQA